ncbi:MAG: AMP-binding protein, partial [Candidatus Entotheonellia bacterium]
MNTADFLSIPAAIVPEQELIVFEGRRQTYRETVERVNRLTNALAALGVSKGDHLAVLDTNSSRYVEAYFAASKLGAVFVPLNYRAKAAELEYMVAVADTRVLLVGDRYVPLVA